MGLIFGPKKIYPSETGIVIYNSVTTLVSLSAIIMWRPK